jgi:hypothetical protein
VKGIAMAFGDIQDKLGLTSASRRAQVERQLDDAVEDSFPASDPVSLAQPHDREELGGSPMSRTGWMLLGGGLLAVVALIVLRR